MQAESSKPPHAHQFSEKNHGKPARKPTADHRIPEPGKPTTTQTSYAFDPGNPMHVSYQNHWSPECGEERTPRWVPFVAGLALAALHMLVSRDIPLSRNLSSEPQTEAFSVFCIFHGMESAFGSVLGKPLFDKLFSLVRALTKMIKAEIQPPHHTLINSDKLIAGFGYDSAGATIRQLLA